VSGGFDVSQLRTGLFGSRGLRYAQRAFFSDLDGFMAELPSSIDSGRLDQDPSGLPVALSNVRVPVRMPNGRIRPPAWVAAHATQAATCQQRKSLQAGNAESCH
jgi:hypothetical protein